MRPPASQFNLYFVTTLQLTASTTIITTVPFDSPYQNGFQLKHLSQIVSLRFPFHESHSLRPFSGSPRSNHTARALANATQNHRIITMDNTIDLSELTLQESGKMDHYEENGFQEPELLFEASANETDQNSETDESLDSDQSHNSDQSLESDESLDGDDYLETADKVNPAAHISADDELEKEDEELQGEDDAFHSQEEELDQANGVQMEAGTSDDIKVAPKKSKWLTQWFQRQEELY